MSASPATGVLAGLSREEKARLFEQLRARGTGAAAPAGIPRLAERPEPLPLSFAQGRLWVIDRLAPGNPTYHIPTALSVRGSLDPAAMAAALTGVATRHEALRTRFVEAEAGLGQRVEPPAQVPLPMLDLARLSAAAKARELERAFLAESTRPFVLATGPVFRAALARLAPSEHALLLNLHHIVSDGWSSSILVRETAALYEAAVERRPCALPPLPIQYADFAVWQRRFLSGAELDRQLGFWRERLAGAPRELPLPLDRARPAAPSARGGRVDFDLPPGVDDQIRSLAQAEGATPFMVLFAAWALFLGRLAGVSDLVIGTPIANRNRAETAGLIGFFVNTLALRLDVFGEPTFRELILRARRAALDAYAHQDLPFERLVEEINPERNLAVSPIFQALFSFLNTPVPELAAAGLAIEPIDLAFSAAKFDLSLHFRETGDRLLGSLEYSAELFDPATPARWARSFSGLVARAVSRSDLPVAALAGLDAAEREQVLSAWNQSGDAFPGRTLPSLPELCRAQAARTPEAIAVRRGADALTFRALDRRSDRLAAHLAARGARPEVLVGVCLGRGVDLVVALLGALKSGAGCLPLDPNDPPERLALVLEDAGCRLLIGDAALLGRLAAGLGSRPLPSGLEIVSVDGFDGEAPAAPPVLAPPLPENLAYASYTSGSTGRPEGVVVIEHRQAAAMLAWAETAFGPEERAGMLAATPIGFDLSVFEIFLPLASGGTVLIAENALELPEVAGWGDVRMVVAVPSAVAEIVRRGAMPASVRTVCLAGEPLAPELLDALDRTGTVRRILNLYGSSEDATCSMAAEFLCGAPLAAAEKARRGTPPIGRPIAGARSYLLDARMDPVPPGSVGEIFLGGAGVARGYLGRPELTAGRFVPDPFATLPGSRLYRTGDLGRHRVEGDPAGEILFAGRRRGKPPHPDAAAPSADAFEAPATTLERFAANLWAEVLGIDPARVGRRSSFFDLGGHSLLGAQVATRVERQLQVSIPLRSLFEHPTLEGFAGAITALDPHSGRAEKIARAVLRVQGMSEDQKRALRGS